jgi:hypothetical protein
MSSEPLGDEEDMPAEVDFSHATRGADPRLSGDEVTIRVMQPDGRVEEHREPMPRMDPRIASPWSRTGAYDGVLYYSYNPLLDSLYARLIASLSEAAELEPAEPGCTLLRSTETGRVVGMIVENYLRRFARIRPEEAATVEVAEVLEPPMSGLADRLQAA